MYLCTKIMLLELLHVTIGQQIRSLSMSVGEGQLVTITGSKGSGKSLLLRAILGLIPVDDGFISIDGELMTPQSGFYFRKQMAYVPQHLSFPKGYHGAGMERWDDLTADERYLLLLNKAIATDKQMLIVDEPEDMLTTETQATVDQLLQEAAQRGKTVVAVNPRIQKNQVVL